jgi:signal transduction histidine kinase
MRAKRALEYLIAVLAAAAAVQLGLLIRETSAGAETLLLVAAIVLSSWRGGLGPGLVATAIVVCAELGPSIHPPHLGVVSWARAAILLAVALLIVGSNVVHRRAEWQWRQARGELEARVSEASRALAQVNEDLRQQFAAGRQKEDELLAYQGRLRDLAAELSYAEERERQRIATQLHDDIGQTLSICQMRLESLRETAPADLPETVAQIVEVLEQTITRTRTLTCQLSPPVLRELGLVAAIQWLSEQVAAQSGLRIRVDAGPEPATLDEDLRIVLFQVARELLANVVKHAGARHVTVSLWSREGQVRLGVEDDGVGFETKPAASGVHGGNRKKNSFGLFSIRERLRHCGGQLVVESEAGRGARCTVVLNVRNGDRPLRGASQLHEAGNGEG